MKTFKLPIELFDKIVPKILIIHPKETKLNSIKEKYLEAKRLSTESSLIDMKATAAILPEDIEVSMIDLNNQSLSDEELQSADLVLFSSNDSERDSVTELLERCKSATVHVAAHLESKLKIEELTKEIDYVLDSFEKKVLIKFIEDWQWGRAKHLYA